MNIPGLTNEDHDTLTQMQQQPGPTDLATLARILQRLMEHCDRGEEQCGRNRNELIESVELKIQEGGGRGAEGGIFGVRVSDEEAMANLRHHMG